MVEGRANQEIADALGISLRTAQTHVAHILAKLDVDSRTAAATRAVARDGSNPVGSVELLTPTVSSSGEKSRFRTMRSADSRCMLRGSQNGTARGPPVSRLPLVKWT